MAFAERYAFPIDARIGTSVPRTNDFKELFYVRWGNIWFNVFWGQELNLKVVLNVYRSDGVCERFIVDTDPHDVQWNRHKRATSDFFVHPSPLKLGHITRITFSFIAHLHNRSISSQHEYVFFEERELRDDCPHHRHVPTEGAGPNGYRTWELDAGELQRDVDWCNHHFEFCTLRPNSPKASHFTHIILSHIFTRASTPDPQSA